LLLRRRNKLPVSLIEGLDVVGREEFAEQYGADSGDVDLVRNVLVSAGVEIVGIDAAARHVVVADKLPAVPAQLKDVVLRVVGLDVQPLVRPQYRTLAGQPQIVYTPPELGRLYEFPADTDGAGQTLAIISVTGGYQQRDMDAYFSKLGIRTPVIRDVSIGGVKNEPGKGADEADREVVLDLQVAGSLAPGAHIVNYFTDNTDRGIVDALRTAVHANPTPTVISLSWGAPEESFSASLRDTMNDIFAEAAALGITVVAASGNEGSGAGVYDGGSHTMFPASSPYVLACGGTTLIGDPATGRIESETAWNTGSGSATGGGVSKVFDLPTWQVEAGVPTRYGQGGAGRGVPDVAGNADPRTGYQVLIDGRLGFMGGTSATAPLWAALVCRLTEALGRPLGLLQPLVYHDLVPGKVTAGFRDVVAGDNGAYTARPGWDPNTGLGSPHGTALLTALREKVAHS
jgi:kumamolisin